MCVGLVELNTIPHRLLLWQKTKQNNDHTEQCFYWSLEKTITVPDFLESTAPYHTSNSMLGFSQFLSHPHMCVFIHIVTKIISENLHLKVQQLFRVPLKTFDPRVYRDLCLLCRLLAVLLLSLVRCTLKHIFFI